MLPQWVRPSRLFGLTLLVLAAHLWLAAGAWPDRLGEGAADTRPVRMNVSFVRQLQAVEPAPAAAVRSVPRTFTGTPVARPALAASAAGLLPAREPAPSAPPLLPEALAALAPEPVASEPVALRPVVSPASSAAPAALAVSAPSPAASSAPAARFDWPPSTRLTYRLTGHYRGPVEGQASVEWLRKDQRYQVFMDLSIGPSFAPLMSRRVASSGEITAQGLRPQRYDEETKVLLRAPRRLVVEMGEQTVRLANGQESARPPGLQDSASQFVQLTWLFTMQPALLQSGRSIDVPLALPRVVEPWTYDVLGAETLFTPAGAVSAVHVKPRREARPGTDMTAEIWVAPSLQYLPVRILIRQDADTWIDLNIDRLPEQAAPGK